MEGRGFGFVTFTDAAHAQSFLEVGLNNNLDHVAKPLVMIPSRNLLQTIVCFTPSSALNA